MYGTKSIVFCPSWVFWIACSVLFLGLLPRAQGQVNTSIGLRAGLNIANFYGKDASDYESKIGANAGLVINHSIKPTFGITAELDFAMKGATQSNRSIALNYGQISLIPTYYFNQSGSDLVPKGVRQVRIFCIFASTQLNHLLR
jgi:hypothetical protein